MAAMIVVLCHSTLAFHPALLTGQPSAARFAGSIWISRTPLTFFYNPELGVAIFFVLSGFVLAASVHAKPAPFSELALRRWIRLSGTILGTSLIIWVIVEAGLLYNQPVAAANGSDWLAGNFAWLAYQSNDLWQVFRQSLFDIYVHAIHWWNFALWTMPVEFWGSMGLFACYTVLRRTVASAPIRLMTACVVLALSWRSAYGGFAAGALLYETSLLLRPRNHHPALAWVAGGVLLVPAILLGGMPWNLAGTPYWTGFAWLSGHMDSPILAVHRFGAICVVAATLLFPPLQFAFTTRPFRFLGRISFTLYLLHIVLICSLFSWVVLHLTPRVGYNAATATGFVLFLVTLLGAATVAEALIDQPTLRLAKAGGTLAPRAIAMVTNVLRSRLALARQR